MSQNQKTGRLSLILEAILFLLFVLSTILLFSKLNDDYYNISGAGEENLLYDYYDVEDIVAQNKTYIKKIKDEYGISIYYGENIKKVVEKIDATILQDEFIVNNNLKVIYNSLKKYPNDVFEISKSKKYPINIILVDSFLNDNLALASRNNLNEFRLYLSNNSKFERAFHHEMYHILEFYMSDKYKYLYSSWYSLNPAGFSYVQDVEKLNDDYVYNSKLNESNEKQEINSISFKSNPYFITKYSKVSEKEDRAEIFAEMMMQVKKSSYLRDGQNIRKKALVITDAIGNNITKNEFYFNQFL